MKVCTDACLFGAWAAETIKNSGLKIKNVLDIGCGTGLLALMFAQKNIDVIIDAVEIDEAAIEQAKENFNNSGWKEKLKAYNDSIQHYSTQVNKQYDVIICNSPFFENDLKSEDQKRNLALHSSALLLEELIFAADVLLKKTGSFFCLLPFHRTKYFEDLLLKNKLCLKEKIFIKQTPAHNYFRTMLWVDRNSATLNQSEIIIINDENKYTGEFIKLLKDYYLNF